MEEVFPDEPSWTGADTVKLAGILAEHGVDLLDVSSAALHPSQRIKTDGPVPYQTPFAGAVKKEHGVDTPRGLFVGAVGSIKTGPVAEDVLQRGLSDFILIGRQFQKDPATVLTFAEQLGIRTKVAHQIGWGLGYGKTLRGKH